MRPIVLIATTDPNMAYALHQRLKEPCRNMGSRLDVCPDANKSDGCCDKAQAYESAEALFDLLEKRDPSELADTLVVLDVGTELDNAFQSAASEDRGWHVVRQRTGVAVELLLRFPQIFPVFLSPASPVEESGKSNPSNKDSNIPIIPKLMETSRESWKLFYSLIEAHNKKHFLNPNNELISCFKQLHAFQVPLHFISPLDGGYGLESTLVRFARGMRCWFDPTGLRTLVKNRYLGTVFGNQTNWENSKDQRDVLLDRLNNICVAIDEEREFALLNAYTAWKFGCSAWVVTTFGEFDEFPLWVNTADISNNVTVLRDIDLRFPDIPDSSEQSLPNDKSPRDLLRDLYSCLWFKKEDRDCKKNNNGVIGNKIGKNWLVRVVSGECSVDSKWENWKGMELQIGQRKKNERSEYLGLKKPIGTIYELASWLFSVQAHDKQKKESITARLKAVSLEGSKGGHGAPYTNMAMAESLLKSSSRCEIDHSAHFIGALLAMEAYELLLGMSKTLVLEALRLLHEHEVAAEVKFPGIAHSLNINDRKKDVELTMENLYKYIPENNRQVKDVERVKRTFLSQFWDELRIQYRGGDQFGAAEEANVQSLLNMSWSAGWLSWPWRSCKILQFLKWRGLRTATSLTGWILTTMFTSFILAVSYAGLSEEVYFKIGWKEFVNFLEIWWQVVMEMLQMQLNGTKERCVLNGGVWLHLIAMLHLGGSYVLFGLMIAMIYRKITRT